MNILLAFVLLLGVTATYGVSRPQPAVAEVQACIVPGDATDTSCTGKAPTPAAPMGLQPGDRIVAFNGQPVDVLGRDVDADPGQPRPPGAS